MSNCISSAIDVGNGFTKGEVNGVNFNFPSVVALKYGGVDIPVATDKAGELFEGNFFDEMDVSFDSPLVENNTRRLFGKRAVKSGMSLEVFDVFSTRSKCECDLFGVLSLGSIAGITLVQYYKKNKKLPKDIVQIETIYCTALPINEYKRHRSSFAKKFLESSHIVTFHNFEFPVRVEIKFKDMKVLSEGEAAGVGLKLSSEKLMQIFLDDARKSGEKLEGITAKDLLMADNTLGIDIGEGTINFAVFTNGEFNYDASKTYNRGYGFVLENSLDKLRDAGYPFKNRKELTDFLMKEPTALTRKRRENVLSVVEDETRNFAMTVSAECSKVIASSGSFIELIFVYGGGSTPLKKYLLNELFDLLKTFSGDEDEFPVLYMTGGYAQYMNQYGLNLVATKLIEHLRKDSGA